MNTKILIGLVATLVWVLAIVAKHFWPDIDIGGIVTAAGSALSGLGVYHVTTKDAKDDNASVLLPPSTTN